MGYHVTINLQQDRAMRPLKKYLMKTGETYESFAKKVGVSKYTIMKYCNATRRPGKEWIRARIAKVTNGQVGFGDWA